MKYLGIVLLVLSGNVMAEEVYYCSDNVNGATGFLMKDRQYKQLDFHEVKFKMKLQDDGNIAIDDPDPRSLEGKDLYLCATPYKGTLSKHKTHKSCVDDDNIGWFFHFNPDNGRYVFLSGSGYVFHDGDPVVIRIGTCTKF